MDAISLGLIGLERAAASVDRVADRLSRMPTSVAEAGGGGDTVDLSTEITTLLVAKNSYQANLKAIETASEMAGSTLDVLG